MKKSRTVKIFKKKKYYKKKIIIEKIVPIALWIVWKKIGIWLPLFNIGDNLF